MSHTVEVRPDQPIIVVTYQGVVDAQEMAEVQQAIAQAIPEMHSEQVFCILDIRNSTTNFLDAMTNVKQIAFTLRKYRDRADIHLAMIFVGMKPLVQTVIQMLQLLNRSSKVGFRVLAVEDVDKAMDYIQKQLSAA